MKITDISIQARNPDRVNVSVDGKYRFSLDITQVTELGVKIGNDYSDYELAKLESESNYGKLYATALEYTLMRPHSEREVRDYLWRKTRTTKYKSRRTGEIMEREGASQQNADRVLKRLVDRGYVDDTKFAKYWVENRKLRQGISIRKLQNELMSKGVPRSIIESTFTDSERDENEELKKMYIKKRPRYEDDQKLIAYLLRQGFSYDAVKAVIEFDEEDD